MTSFNIYNYASQEQIDHFKPTFLYIKQHKVTGLMYFGKTTNKNPIYYKGSGTRWGNHLKVHGKEHVETIWYCLFTDIESLVETAINLSEFMNILNKEIFANLIIENGLNRFEHNEYTRKLVSENNKIRKISVETKERLSKSLSGKVYCKDLNGNNITINKEEFNPEFHIQNRKGKLVLVNRYTKEKIDINVSDKNLYDLTIWLHPLCKGLYHTPNGIFQTLIGREAQWCKNNEKVITKYSFASLKQKHDACIIGKTPKELGYFYEYI